MTLTAGRTRLYIHPLALLFPLTAAMLGARQDITALLFSLCVHEAFHLMAAHGLGISIRQLRLMPFGGAIDMENPYALPPSRLLGVAAAGPLGSGLVLLAVGALAHWQILPASAALGLARINLMLLLFNLLPALPLDGGRMLYALLCPRLGREKAVEKGIWAGRVVALALLITSLMSAVKWGRLNLSILLASVFILASSADERRALSQTRADAILGALKPIQQPVSVRLWAVGDQCDTHEALRVVRPDVLTLYAVYKGSRLSSITDDRRLLEASLEHGPKVSVGEAVKL